MRARNDAAHPGTSDMSDSDAQDHFSNILKILHRINAVDAATAIEQIRRQLRNPSPSASPNISTQPAMANSICANIRCQNINQYQPHISADGGVPLQCPICLAQQFVSTCIAVSCDKYGGNNSPFQYSLRTRFPNGNESVIEFYHSLNITIGRGDRLTFSVDHKDRLVYLVNENIRRWWYFPGGPKEFSGCYSKLSNWIAINTYGPEANAITYSIADVIGRMLKGHPQIPLTGRCETISGRIRRPPLSLAHALYSPLFPPTPPYTPPSEPPPNSPRPTDAPALPPRLCPPPSPGRSAQSYARL